MRRRRRRPDRHSNHFQRLHEHSTRGVEHPDPDKCGCNGGGWINSSCDVWEKCHKHYDGQPHPEDRRAGEPEDLPDDLEAEDPNSPGDFETEEDLPFDLGDSEGGEDSGGTDQGEGELPF